MQLEKFILTLLAGGRGIGKADHGSEKIENLRENLRDDSKNTTVCIIDGNGCNIDKFTDDNIVGA